MKIDSPTGRNGSQRGNQAAFTLLEVAIAMLVAALVLAGMFQGYNLAGRRSTYSACSLAANTQAMGQVEQVEAASWFPSPPYNNNTFLTLGKTNTGNLCLPSSESNMVNCTNIVTITCVSSNPYYAVIQAQCIWSMPNYGGVYTNTISVLRAPNL